MGDVGTGSRASSPSSDGHSAAVGSDVLGELLPIGVREVEEDGQSVGGDEWRVDLHGDRVLVGMAAGADVDRFAGQLEVAVDDACPQVEFLADACEVAGDRGSAVGKG